MKVITNIFKWISLVFMGLMSILNFANVISRYFLSSTIAWTDEIIVFMFIWISMLGAAYAFLNNSHLGMDLLSITMGRKGNIFLTILSLSASASSPISLWRSAWGWCRIRCALAPP